MRLTQKGESFPGFAQLFSIINSIYDGALTLVSEVEVICTTFKNHAHIPVGTNVLRRPPHCF